MVSEGQIPSDLAPRKFFVPGSGATRFPRFAQGAVRLKGADLSVIGREPGNVKRTQFARAGVTTENAEMNVNGFGERS